MRAEPKERNQTYSVSKLENYTELKNMQTQDKAIGLVLVALLITTLGFTFIQQAEILSFKEQVGAGDGERGDIGAWITFTVIKQDGSSYIAWEGHNAMTSLGLDYICEQVAGTQGADMDYIAIGEGTGGTTALNNEFDRQQGSFTAGTTGVYTMDYTWIAGSFSAETITEAGCLNAAVAGTLFNYQTFTGIPLTATDSLAVEFEFTFS